MTETTTNETETIQLDISPDNKTTILHLVPSGILHEHVKCIIGNGVVVDPWALLDEIYEIKNEMPNSVKIHLPISMMIPL